MSSTRRHAISFVIAAFGLLAVAPQAQAAPFDAGLRIGSQTTEQDLGLPLFPGAKAQQDDKEDKAAVRLDLWGGAFGVRMAVGKFRTPAKASEVQAFYAKALAAHGAVLECKGPAPKSETKPEKREKGDKNSDAPLSCSDTRADGLVLKVGTERNQRHVAIQSKGDETFFQIVRIELRRD